MVRDQILAGRLIPVLQRFESPAIEVHALFAHLHLMSMKVRAFTDFLVERCVIEELGRPLPT
jgi:DNA-binding transcriptional LysR family regulator